MPAEPGSVHGRRGWHVDVDGRGWSRENSLSEVCRVSLIVQFATDIQWVMQGVMRSGV